MHSGSIFCTGERRAFASCGHNLQKVLKQQGDHFLARTQYGEYEPPVPALTAIEGGALIKQMMNHKSIQQEQGSYKQWG